MADRQYGAVPPPTGNMQGQSFAEALRKAREIAKSMAETAENSRKRHLDEPPDSPPSKYYVSNSGAGGRIDPQRAIAEARAKAAAFVAQSRQQYGMGGVVTNDILIPNKCVGLVIGRGGDVISRLQAESMANIQVASDGIPTPHERQITITGTPESVNKAEALIHDIVKEKEGGPMGQMDMCTEEILIPGPKVGMVIGKGGETIKRMQDALGCKIVIIQDSHSVQATPKPLRIMGGPEAVARAKKMVEDILDSVDGGHGQVTISVLVPNDMVGMIIGKQGENIRRIQMDTNTKIQFADENDTGFRTALLSGPESGARQAESMVKDMIAARAQDKSGRNPPGVQTVKVGVPHTRTGVVIGKGGETIRLLQQQSGAHIELDRNEEPGQTEKFFVVRGTDDQIVRAKQLIKEKTDPEGLAQSAPGQEGYQAAAPTGGYTQDQMAAYQMWYAQYAAAAAAASGGTTGQSTDATQAAWTAYYQQYFNQMAGGGTQQAGQTAGGAAGDQQSSDKQQTTEGQPDYTAQWAEYYRQMGYAWPQAQSGQTQQPAVSQSGAQQPTPQLQMPQQQQMPSQQQQQMPSQQQMTQQLQQQQMTPQPQQMTQQQQQMPLQPMLQQQQQPMQRQQLQQQQMQQQQMQQQQMPQQPMPQQAMPQQMGLQLNPQQRPLQPTPPQQMPQQQMPLQPNMPRHMAMQSTMLPQPRCLLQPRPGMLPVPQPPPPGAM